ncbi:acetyl-coenzyme A synthetase 2-like, mitochondrial isoform X5 [Lagenorhynchus albirostris]|uniref:acetyl-coenzyme A synthetase 2-like, mitochondrial isoform X5 n=1 Tax=Lagenorhynchus albirostris TaxID=27610 RepID=UPI0028EFF65A|nr:acetyl-coenzyme A synthetase 2-like, mitochondrial isoform X5 [Lagenorhynchus albirostris]
MAARCLGRGVVRLLGGLRGVGARGLAAPRLWGSASAPAAPAGSYQERIALAASEPAAFWGPLARDVLVWDTPYHTVSDCDFRSGRIGWFLGGQLNVSVNCLDQHVRKSPESVALIWEQDEPGTEVRITYRELLETTCRLANTLKRHGVHRGDRVAIYMPVSPLAVAAMLACARIGAIHTVVFAGFSAGSLAARINDVGEPINHEAWEWLHRVVGDSRCTLVDTWWQTETGGICISPRPSEEGAEILPCMAMRPLFGIVPVLMDEKGNVLKGGDVSGALCLSQAWPGMARTIFGDHQRFVDAYFKAYPGETFLPPLDLVSEPFPRGRGLRERSLLSLPLSQEQSSSGFSQGLRPWAPRRRAGRHLGDNRGGSRPPPGLHVVVFPTCVVLFGGSSRTRVPLETDALQSQARYYFTGDGAYRTEDGYYQITGRMDDVINISGHRLGTAEIEDAMADHPAVPETAVIGYPHDIKGEAAFAFIVLKDDAGDADVVVKELRSVVASKIAKYAVPDQVLVVKRLPKTRSGKVMRRLLRKIVTGGAQDLGDITTMEDPTVITEILSAYQEYKDKWGAAQ